MSSSSRFQAEIQQTVPFASSAHEGVVALMIVADRVERHLAKVLCTSGITTQQYNVLRILRGAGPQGLPTLEVGCRMIEQAPGVTRLLDRLENKGLVIRDRVPEDRRQVWAKITPRGLAILESLDDVVDRADRDALRGLTEPEQRRLIALLEQALTGLE